MTPGSTWGSTAAFPSGPAAGGGTPRAGAGATVLSGAWGALFAPEALCENEDPESVGLEPVVEVEPMPLSEDEQRILQEIEAQFYANDPHLAQQVSETTLYRHAARSIKWAALGFVVGFVVLLTSFASSLFFGFVGFLAMLGCAWVIVINLRKMGKAGLESITASVKGKKLKNFFGDAGKNFRRPFRKEDGSN